MEFIAGTILLVAAIALLGVAKYAVSHWEESSFFRKFAGTEAIALLITTMSAFGLGFLFAGLAGNTSTVGYSELAASIGMIALAAYGVSRTFRRSSRRATASATHPSTGAMA